MDASEGPCPIGEQKMRSAPRTTRTGGAGGGCGAIGGDGWMPRGQLPSPPRRMSPFEWAAYLREGDQVLRPSILLPNGTERFIVVIVVAACHSNFLRRCLSALAALGAQFVAAVIYPLWPPWRAWLGKSLIPFIPHKTPSLWRRNLTLNRGFTPERAPNSSRLHLGTRFATGGERERRASEASWNESWRAREILS